MRLRRRESNGEQDLEIRQREEEEEEDKRMLLGKKPTFFYVTR